MVMPACGTFDYVAVVPKQPTTLLSAHLRTPVVPFDSQRWLEHRSGSDDSSRALFEDRLVGYDPTISIDDAGITPDGSVAGNVLPKVLRSRITMTAATRSHARVRSATFHVDSALSTLLQPRDRVFFGRTDCGGVGMSVVRDGRLVVAVGAVSSVPLGDHVRVHTPHQLVVEGERPFKGIDPDFHFPELPVQVDVDGTTRIFFRARTDIGDYFLWVEHGFFLGLPGTEMCVAIALKRACPDVAAIASAQLLDDPSALLMTPWP